MEKTYAITDKLEQVWLRYKQAESLVRMLSDATEYIQSAGAYSENEMGQALDGVTDYLNVINHELDGCIRFTMEKENEAIDNLKVKDDALSDLESMKAETERA